MQDISVDSTNLDLDYEHINELVNTEVLGPEDSSYLENESYSEDNSDSGEYASEEGGYSSDSSQGYDSGNSEDGNSGDENGDYTSEEGGYSSDSSQGYDSENSGDDNSGDDNGDYTSEGDGSNNNDSSQGYDSENSEDVDSLYSEDGNSENSSNESNESVFYPNEGESTAEPQNGGNRLDVESDFGGDLESAIASAKDGDVVALGNNRYYTDGITLDKDITLTGKGGSVIDGGGTSNSIIKVTAGASGSTIENIEITNGNNGIAGDGASNLTLRNLEIHNIGNSQTNRYGQNNTAIELSHVDGIQISDSEIYNVGRKGIGIGATVGGVISNVDVRDVNLDAQHAQSHDAAGIKFYNTTDVTVANNYLSNINANHIWNDTATGTKIQGNTIDNVGSDFIAPGFNDNVEISGIYNEKSHNSSVSNNTVTAIGDFSAFDATTFTTETMSISNNNFSSMATDTTDYWTNQGAEQLIATTEDPKAADFSLFADEYNNTAHIDG